MVTTIVAIAFKMMAVVVKVILALMALTAHLLTRKGVRVTQTIYALILEVSRLAVMNLRIVEEEPLVKLVRRRKLTVTESAGIGIEDAA